MHVWLREGPYYRNLLYRTPLSNNHILPRPMVTVEEGPLLLPRHIQLAMRP